MLLLRRPSLFFRITCCIRSRDSESTECFRCTHRPMLLLARFHSVVACLCWDPKPNEILRRARPSMLLLGCVCFLLHSFSYSWGPRASCHSRGRNSKSTETP